MLDADTTSQIRGSCNCEGGGGVGGVSDENWDKKIGDYEVGWFFFDVYQHLAKPDDEADRPRLM